ncbi:IS66 family insertion sequence element accessory protein TnpB [Sinorhizobium medicae]|nr:IS66 family insertion sequence element accessory protein TnpB [Sinorhizobium medicae]MDX0420167.1 IS66 family insertion sequence element accessory protein TnpB [Sinorhizobium medicae]MDX1034715.1 IS66 family insertion sequence element accessory protein TnpB [Sinorhizobium medicae]
MPPTLTLASWVEVPFNNDRFGNRIKLLFWDGQGFCLYYKVLETGRFPWPSAADGTARLTAAQLAMLWEGIDWRRPSWSSAPKRSA